MQTIQVTLNFTNQNACNWPMCNINNPHQAGTLATKYHCYCNKKTNADCNLSI